MNPFVLFFTFIFLFSTSWGMYTEDEIKKMWTDTGYGFENLFYTLDANLCYKSEKKFSACLLAFNDLLLKIKKEGEDDKFHQLGVSDAGQLEITSIDKENFPKTEEDLLVSIRDRREAFRSLYQKIMTPKAETDSPLPVTTDSVSQTPPHIRLFDDLVSGIVELTTKVPQGDISYIAGGAYRFYLKEAIGLYSDFYPLALKIPRINRNRNFAIGAIDEFYETEDGDNGLVVYPIEGSSAELAGLQKGDMILGIDGFDLTNLTSNDQVLRDITGKLRGFGGTRVKLRVQKICDDSHEQREITVVRSPAPRRISHWFSDSFFVSLDQPESLGCNNEIKQSGAKPGQLPDPTASPRDIALYVPLKVFEPAPKGHFADHPLPLCREFLILQKAEISKPQSRGMIIDLRDNPGGSLGEAACMLNSIIESQEIIVRLLPIEDGKFRQTSDGMDVVTYYFTEDGFLPNSETPLPFIYNKNIVVLVDELSASASEVFAGTLQEMKRGWVVGRRTVGKGTTMKRELAFVGEESSIFRGIETIFTTGIYTLNSGRSPQGYGIVPDFHVSGTGEDIKDSSYISPWDRLFFDSISFENNQWEQNRQEELTRLIECVRKEDQLGEIFRKKIQKDKRYARPFIGDYQLELAKDILKCSSPRKPDIITKPRISRSFLGKEERINKIE